MAERGSPDLGRVAVSGARERLAPADAAGAAATRDGRSLEVPTARRTGGRRRAVEGLGRSVGVAPPVGTGGAPGRPEVVPCPARAGVERPTDGLATGLAGGAGERGAGEA